MGLYGLRAALLDFPHAGVVGTPIFSEFDLGVLAVDGGLAPCALPTHFGAFSVEVHTLPLCHMIYQYATQHTICHQGFSNIL